MSPLQYGAFHTSPYVYILSLTPEKRQIRMVAIKERRISTESTYLPLIDAFGALPNLQVLTGINCVSEQFIKAVNDSSIPSFNFCRHALDVLPLEHIKSNPDVVRKLRIQQYSLNTVAHMEWLSVATPVYIYDLMFPDVQTGSSFLDHPPTVSFVESIRVRTETNNDYEAARFTEKLRTYTHGPGQSVTRIDFSAWNFWFERTPSLPWVGSLLNFLRSTEATSQDDPPRLILYEISRAAQWQQSSYNDWDAWRITSLRILACPSEPQFFKALSKQAAFLETLWICEGEQDFHEQWTLDALSKVCVFSPHLVRHTH
jgi:hypothetical protein